jgi:hypothetical protein
MAEVRLEFSAALLGTNGFTSAISFLTFAIVSRTFIGSRNRKGR